VQVKQRGQQLDRCMVMSQAMAEVSDEVQPGVQRQQTATDSVKLAIQLIADRSRAVAAAAKEAASTAAAQAVLAAEAAARGWEQENSR
jgi:methyl-accepting chemotaxis protein